MREEDKMTSLLRILDNLTATLPTDDYEAFLKGGPIIPAVFFLYTKWGGPRGDYVEELRIAAPDGTERKPGSPVSFRLEGGHHFSQIRRRIQFGIQEPGVHTLRLFVNDHLVAEHSLAIYVIPERVSGAATQQPEQRT
jgi:hypothetical protein